MSHLEQTVKRFLKKHYQGGRLLLALSGGPDSRALFELLWNEFPLEVAHVDHGWRKESGGEALQLERLCEERSIPFHLHRLKEVPERNREEVCREARYAFFADLQKKKSYEALLLGQHADDQAETVLKRLLEGASLVRQGAMLPVSEREGLTLWRPFLSLSKRRILNWLDVEGISYFDDASNRDPAFLRSRMRTELLPQLFGKEVAEPLGRHAEEVIRLGEYLDRRVARYRQLIEERGRVHLSDVDPVEVEHLLRSLFPLSRQQLEALTHAIFTKAYNHRQGPFLAHGGELKNLEHALLR